MTGRQFLLTLILLLGFSAQALASPLPLIVKISPAASIATIATVLGGSLVDTIPGDNLYLLSVPAVPPSFLASTLGIEWMELNIGVTLPRFAQVGRLTVPATIAADWYKDQPSMQLIRAGPASSYSTGQGVVVADRRNRAADQRLEVDIRLGGNFTGDHDQAGGSQGFAGDTAGSTEDVKGHH